MLRFGLATLVLGLSTTLLGPCEPIDATPTEAPTLECFHTGCSGQICSDVDVISTCEWTCDYGCYQQAECTQQADTGQCGFTPTAQLEACLAACGVAD